MRELYDEQQSGVLTVHHRGGGPWILYVYEGHPQYVVEPDPQHRLGEALAHSGLVSPEDVERAVELGERENRRIGLALAQLGLLTEYQLRGILRTLVEVRLGSFFEMDRGEWSFVRDDRSRRDLVLTRIDMARVIFGGLKDHFAWDVARDNLLADQDRFLRRNPEMEEQLLGLKLSPKELRFAQDVIDGTKTLRQVLGYSTLKASETYQMVHALVATGFLHLTGEALATAREGQVADDLGHKIRTLRGANHFDVLEIHWSCIEDDVQKAYERLKREYGPEGKWVKGAPDLEKMSAEILAAVEVSYRAVIHQSDRRSYRRELISPEKIGYAVEFNLGQAKNHRFTEDLPAMAECLERVKELSPGTSTEI